MARLEICLLGGFTVHLDGKPVAGFRYRKVRALLAFLAAEADRAHRREALTALLWPDVTPKIARSNLRYALSDLRKNIADGDTTSPYLLITPGRIQFNLQNDILVDAIEFIRRIKTSDATLADLMSAIELYRGSFLEGFEVGDSAAFEDWLAITRESYQRDFIKALSRISALYEQEKQFDQALLFANRQLVVEPWLEEAHQQAMRLLATMGERSAALSQYEKCRRALADELGVEPGEKTRRLYSAIRDGLFLPASLPVLYQISLKAIAERQSDLNNFSGLNADFFSESGSGTSSDVPFVSRQNELNRLGFALQQALEGKGQVRFIIGGPGQGKTALAREFIRTASLENPGLVAATGYCQAYIGQGDPYLPFREILELLCGEVQDQWDAHAISRENARRLCALAPQTIWSIQENGPTLVETFIRGDLLLRGLQRIITGFGGQVDHDWLTSLHELVNSRKATLYSASPHASSDQEALFYQYSKVMVASSRQVPIILFLDDLQWADAGSLGLLFTLGRRIKGSRILLIGAFRPISGSQFNQGDQSSLSMIVNEFKLRFDDLIIDLDELEDRDLVEAYLDLEPNQLDNAFREKFFEYSGGNPLFTIELLRWLKRCGGIFLDEKQEWIARPEIDWVVLPTRIEAVIEARIEHLPKLAKELLQVACIEGERFTAEVISRVVCVDPLSMVDLLSGELGQKHQLIRSDSLRRINEQTLTIYRFQHILYQVYLYRNLDPLVRAHLHTQVGNILETLYGEQKSEIAGTLAHHFEQAGIFEKAVAYSYQAGKRAAEIYSFQEACVYFTHALEMLSAEDFNWKYTLLLELESVHHRSGQREAQITDIRALEALLDRFGPGQRAEVALRRCRFDYCCWDWAMLYEDTQVALSQAKMAGNLALEAEGYMYLSSGYEGLLMSGDAEMSYHRALDIAHMAGVEQLEATILREIGRFYIQVKPIPVKSRQYAEDALKIFHRISDRHGELISLSLLGVCLIAEGDYIGALRQFDICRQICRTMGNRFEEVWAVIYSAFFYQYVGRTDIVEDELLDAIEVTRELQNEYLEAVVLGLLCGLKWFQRDIPKTIEYIETGLEVLRRGCENGKNLHGVKGIARFMQGFYILELESMDLTIRLEKAALFSRQGAQMIYETGDYYHMHSPLASLAHLELLKGVNGHIPGDWSVRDTTAINRALAYLEESLIPLALKSPADQDPFYLRTFLIAYKVFLVNQDPRAPGILARAYSLLQAELKKIRIEEYRISFIECFPWNREIVQLWNCRSGWQEDRPERVV